MRAFLAISLWCRSGIGEEALAAAPIVDYFIYGRLDDEVNCGISPCPRLLVGKQTQQKLGVLRFYHGYIDIDENMDEKQMCILDLTSKYIKPTSMRVWNTLEVEESFEKTLSCWFCQR